MQATTGSNQSASHSASRTSQHGGLSQPVRIYYDLGQYEMALLTAENQDAQ